jgi:hypothetical protein
VTLPDAPSVSVTPGAIDEVDVAVASPAGTGGSPITSSRYRLLDHGGWTPGDPPATISSTSAVRVEYQVHNAAGWSASAVATGLPGAPAPPDAPILQVDSITSGSVDVSWSAAAPNGRAVDLYEWSVDGLLDLPVDSSVLTTRLVVLGGVTITVQVRAHNSEGWGPWSAAVSASVP